MNKYTLIIVVLAVLFLSALFKDINNFIYLFFFLGWLFFNKTKKIDGRFSIIAGLVFLFFCPFVLNSDAQIAQKFGVWAFLFLLSGVLLLFDRDRNKDL